MHMSKSTKAEQTGVRAVETALSVLETVAFSEEPLGVTQIAAAVGLTKSAVFRHLFTLVDRGFLIQDPSTRYRLGPTAYLIGRLAPTTSDIASIARDAMRSAREASGLAVVISTLTPKGVFVLETLHGTMPIEIGVRPGSHLTLYASAQGKIFLAFGPKHLLDDLRSTGLRKLTSHTIVDMSSLEEDVGRARAQGYAVAPEETLLGINTLAAPVFNHEGKLVAAIAFVGSIQHIPATPTDAQISVIRELSQTVSRALGNGVMKST
jgi:DNA-binding IclR family transcriptional regulator